MAQKIAKNILDLVGRTPLIELCNLQKEYNLEAKIVAKLEYFNPAGSVKDRVAKAMIEDAMKKGKIDRQTLIIEPTSGNTGIGLAACAASLGLKVTLTMPETMSIERRNLLKAYGATLVLTSGEKGMMGAIEKAKEIAKENKNSFLAGQFSNPANPKVHFETTGPEIWQDTDGKVAAFVAGVGTGGTLSGAGAFLKKQNPNVKVFAVEPGTSAVLSGKKAGPHKIQGIGAGFVPETLDESVFDKVIQIDAKDAFAMGKYLAQREGLLVGISSGAAVHVALQIARQEEFKNKMIVALLPDTGERYLSSGMFD